MLIKSLKPMMKNLLTCYLLLSLLCITPVNAELPNLGDPTQKDISPYQEYLMRSEEHTSELQSHHALVCRLLLDKKKKKTNKYKKSKVHVCAVSLQE